MKKKAIVLLSGGLDSTTVLYYAQKKGYDLTSVIFDYGQRHRKEIKQAQTIARRAKCLSYLVRISLPWKGSSLLDLKMALPKRKTIDPGEIPSTYVPARNLIFLSFAASCAEALGAGRIFIGANVLDYSGYPDCRPEFFEALEEVLKRGLKSGVKGKPIQIEAPLLKMTKAQIIRLGNKLGVPYELTWSCYAGGRRACGVCDSCVLRRKGFEVAQMKDPLIS